MTAGEERALLWRIMIEGSPDGLLIAEEGGSIIDANKAACRYLQNDLEQLQRYGLLDIIPAAQRAAVESLVNRTPDRQREHPETVTFSVYDRQQQRSEMELTCHRHATSEATYLFICIRDISERLIHLDRRLTDEKMDGIGRLAGGIAHQFNNLLTSIIGSTEMLQHHSHIDHQAKPYLQRIFNTASRAADLTHSLVSFSRRTDAVHNEVDVHQVIRRALAVLTQSLPPNVRVKDELGAKKTSVYGESGQLEVALLHLFSNAREAMPGGGELLIRSGTRIVDADECHREGWQVEPGRYLTLHIRDQGCGMDAITRNHAFEPFFSTKERDRGLGLAVAYGVIKEHHGHIELRSDPDLGTSVDILLPLDEEVSAGAIEYVDTEDMISGAGTVLLVEDETSIRELGRDMLETLGYQVMEATNGREAVELFEQHHHVIDVVVLDIVLPELGGFESFQAMRAIRSGIRVVIASGFNLGGQRQRFQEAGVAGFVDKPYHLARLSQAIAQAMAVPSDRLRRRDD